MYRKDAGKAKVWGSGISGDSKENARGGTSRKHTGALKQETKKEDL